MKRIIPRADIERFTATLAEKRRRLAKAEHQTRGYRDEDGVWRGGLLSFVRYFWHVLEPGTPFVSGWVLEAICLPRDTRIATRDGYKTIGSIVESRWQGDVLSFNHATRLPEWKPIVHHMKSAGKLLIKIRAGESVLRLTDNHPIFTSERGYVRADQIEVGETLWLHSMPEGVCGPAEQERLLRPKMLRRRSIRQSAGQAYAQLQTLRQRLLSVPIPSNWRVLLNEMIWVGQNKSSKQHLREMRFIQKLERKILPLLSGWAAKNWTNALLSYVRQGGLSLACSASSGKADLRRVLQHEVHGRGFPGQKQHLLCQREAGREISSRILDCASASVEAGKALLLSLFGQSQVGRAPHRPRHEQQRTVESGGALPQVSLFAARALDASVGPGGGHKLGFATVDSVERDQWIPGAVYNIEVLDNNNYFAEDVLVHNCEHLEAVTFGEITNLLINVFPGAMKSLLTDVFWPAWEHGPMGMPHIRYVAFSYSSTLTERDNLKFRDLMASREYREMYPNVTLRQEGARKVSNTAHGWKLASSVGGVGTGERGDRIICILGKTKILTSVGEIRIDQLVQGEVRVSIAGYDHECGKLRWQGIEDFERNPGNAMVVVQHEDGSFECTVDHPVYVEGLGYIRADQVQEGMVLWTLGADAMHALRKGDSTQAERGSEILWQSLPLCLRENEGAGGQQSSLRRMRDDGLSAAITSCEAQGSSVLQPSMPWALQSRGEQSCLQIRPSHPDLQAMPKTVYPQTRGIKAEERSMLFDELRHPSEMGGGTICSEETGTGDLPVLLGAFQAKNRLSHILLGSMRRNESCQESASTGESERLFTLPEGMEQEMQKHHSGEGQSPVPVMPAYPWTAGEVARCAPHRLREGEPRPDESDYAVPLLPQQASWRAEPAQGVEKAIVRSVKSSGFSAETFNIRVSPCHNYFANGVLVHNCDDGHNIKESESETVRNETVRWFRESMSSRLNNMETGAKIVIMQRVNEDDIAGNILSLGLPYVHLQIPMEYVWSADENGDPYTTEIGWVDPRWQPNQEDCEGELAWPDRFPEAVVQRIKKEVGPYGFAAQYQQTPEARGGGLIKREWWIPAEDVMTNDGQKFPPFSYIVASLDGAYTEKEENDPSALTVWGIFENEYGYNRAMLVHAWEKRLQFSGPRMDVYPGEHESEYRRRCMPHWGLIEWVADTCKRFKADKLLIEAKATGISAAQSLRNSHGREGWSIELVDPKGDKMARGMAIVPSFSQEMIYAPDREWATKTIDQCAIFPYGKNDDLFDSTTQAIKHLRDSGLIRSDEERRAQELDAVRHRGAPKKAIYPGFARRRA